MSIRIITDSASDISREELEQHGVELVAMPLLCGDRTILDDKTIPMETFWEMMLSGTHIKTSQPYPESFVSIFEKAAQDGDEVICILMSSGLSGTFQGAQVAANLVGYEKIYFVDTLAATACEKIAVLKACALRDEGKCSGKEIAMEVQQFCKRIKLIACIDTLEYLARGGRLNKNVAGIGNAVQLKPMILLDEEGKVKVFRKTIGKARAMKEMVELTIEAKMDPSYPIIPLYAQNDELCKSYLGKLSDAGWTLPCTAPLGIGATIGAYIGPGGYGMVYVEAE